MTIDNKDLQPIETFRWIVDTVGYYSIVSIFISAGAWIILGIKHWLEVGIWGGSYSVCGLLGVECWPVSGWVGLDSIIHYVLGLSAVVAWFWLSVILAFGIMPISEKLDRHIRSLKNG
jgi:hypothetical protein